MPQLGPSFAAPICRWILVRCGWSMPGEFPNVPKLVAIAAPHSSNWDLIWALLFKVGLRIEVRFMGKREAFFWPLGLVLRACGGIPIDRKAAKNVVGEMAAQFARQEKLWLAIAPEGTRKKVQEWKSGFWRIAHATNVPILPVYFHYPERVIGIGPLFHTSGDIDADIARIRAFYAQFQGKNHGTT
jgi:1-acyl-sn-glycerol-3-phosphate acyltransferase